MTPKQLAYGQRVKRLYPIGTVYTRLTVVGHSRQSSGIWFVLCRCTCGNDYISKHPCHLRNGLVRSCGCLNRELSRERRKGKPATSHLPKGEAALRLVFRSYELHATRRKLSFRLTFQQFKKLTAQNCHYCGDPPRIHNKVGRYYGACIYNGVDRVKNANGYTVHNCVPCCTRCNKAKNTDSKEEFTAWLKRVSLFTSKRYATIRNF